jgi:CubicO group peptidase (beta-lactamase class C family)
MNRHRILIASSLSLWVTSAMAGELPKAEPGEVGLSASKLAELKPAFQKLVEDGRIAGGVALVVRHGKVVFVDAFGERDRATKAPMLEDSIFAIASMTKPITCVAAMTLVEQGKLALDDPVSKYLPELKDLRVLGDAKDDTPGTLATVPLMRPITIRNLFSHTSGFAYGGVLSADVRLGKAYQEGGIQDRGMKTIAEQVARLAKTPLAHQPSERWTYGLSHDVLGRVIEVASGRPLDQYLRDEIFTPLNMPDTSFWVPEAKRDRVATIYRTGVLGGPLIPLPRTFGSETFFSGGGGLFSTARDYARFAQMLLNGGELEGVRILKAESIAAMTSNQIGELSALGLYKYGLGFGLEMSPGREGGKAELANYFWAGFFSTNFWVDPRKDLIGVMMTQILPTNHGNSQRVLRLGIDRTIEK